MFETLLSLQSSDGSGGEGQLTPTEIAAAKMDEVLTKIDDVVFDAGRLLRRCLFLRIEHYFVF